MAHAVEDRSLAINVDVVDDNREYHAVRFGVNGCLPEGKSTYIIHSNRSRPCAYRERVFFAERFAQLLSGSAT